MEKLKIIYNEANVKINQKAGRRYEK